jgi:hypothetical protein
MEEEEEAVAVTMIAEDTVVSNLLRHFAFDLSN